MPNKFFLGLFAALLLTAATELRAGEMVNTICPIMTDHKANSKRVVEYEGKTYGFCCKSCVKKFNKNPQKYLAHMAKSGDCKGGSCQ